MHTEGWNWAARFSAIGLFIIALGFTLHFLEHIAVPLVLAWVIATIILPVVDYLTRIRIPRTIASVLIILALLAGIAAILVILTVPLSYWLSRADELGQLLKEKLMLIQRPLEMLEQLSRVINPAEDGERPPVFVNAPRPNMIASIFGVLTPLLDEFGIFVIALAFHLIYQKEIQDGIVFLVGDPGLKPKTRLILGDIERNMSSYFGTVTIVNVFVGLAVMAITYLLDFPHPLLWGVFAGVMNYIPYLGPALVLGALFVVGAVVFPTLHEPVLAPLLFLSLNTIEGQVITPAFIGHRLTINPFALFVSIAFWTWMWGPLGAFLAVPILIAGMVTLRHLSQTGATA